MTGRNRSGKASRKKASKTTQQQQANSLQQGTSPSQTDDISSPPSNIRKEQPVPQQVVKRILKTENEEAKTLKTVFKSNPDSQMKDFIKIAAAKPHQQVTKVSSKLPAENHSPAVAQELLETDDDVADNLAKLFKASKSFKNV